MSQVEIINVFKDYDRNPVLEHVEADIPSGEFCAIVGASGCGKSTFLRMLLAQELPTQGEIRIGGKAPAREPGPDRGVVFQRYSVFPHMTVRDNLMFPGELQGSKFFGRLFGPAKKKLADEADRVLERIGLSHMADAWPSQLSGGMQQRLAIGQALARRPEVLLLDEPFGALDPGTRKSMHAFLLDLWRETGMTIFMVSHDLSEAFELATRVLVFDKRRWDPQDPARYGATITYDFKLTEKKWKAPDVPAYGPPNQEPPALAPDSPDGKPAPAPS
ncbi:MAG: ABC transporter ATP-binding protein [Minwuia sp.]|uniref:ABC transporter ATP-binding protein n=1 Tax=Minwuia sp. TaxID=2493630 RepID=UPI003A855674